jgi:hypothetical protein
MAKIVSLGSDLAKQKAILAIMPHDPAHQLNRSACQADFSYTMVLNTIKI